MKQSLPAVDNDNFCILFDLILVKLNVLLELEAS